MSLTERHYPVLVTGAAGLLGHALGPRLAAAAPGPEALHLTDVANLDVTDPEAVREAMRRPAPRTVFHLAAWTDVDGAEAHPREAERLNVEGAETVARAAAEAGAIIVHMSTDFVFDGTRPGLYVEDDPPSPLSVYARTKAEAETRVRAAAPDAHLVVRTAWLYGAGGRDFIDAILEKARAGRPPPVVTDQVGCPTWSEDLADALIAMVEADARGTLHACGAGEASRWLLAAEALRAAGLEATPERVATADLPHSDRPRALRPARAVLSTEKLARTVGFRFPPWQDSVRKYVKSM